MIRRILIVLATFMLISVVALWLITGGIGRTQRAAGTLQSPLDILFGGNFNIKLPWAPDLGSYGADISQYTGSLPGQSDLQRTEENISDTQRQVDEARQNLYDVKTFGEPSPYKGMVTIAQRSSEQGTTVSDEYIEISADSGNTAPVTLDRWSLQSVLTGDIELLPRASNLFVAGAVNTAGAAQLNPGARAIVGSGASPTGVSFRENVCSGYLAQFQHFTPELDRRCPAPSDALPETPENLQQYRASCFTYVQGLPACRFPASDPPPGISPQCASFVRNTFTYNGCVHMYQFRADFLKDSWRLYLNATHPLWNASHDIIRLLDAQGRTVDVLKY